MPANPAPRSIWPAVLAGIFGGALVGALDGGSTAARGVGGLVGTRVAWLIVLAIGLSSVAGAVFAAGHGGLARVLDRARFVRGRGRVLAAAVLSLPLVVHDAVAMFSGTKASRIPARGAITVGLVLIGVAAVALAALICARLVARAERRQGRVLPVLAALALAVTAVVAYVANREVLPRLYPWFHLTLSLVTLVAAILATRMVLAVVAPDADGSVRVRRHGPLALAVAAALLLSALPQVTRTQSVRLAAYDRTLIASVLLRPLPIPQQRRLIARSKRVEEALAVPLPQGPRLPDRDVVLITIDALRADHVGAYGYARATTPNLDALARRGVRFERAYAQAPHTSFSVASMLTGKYYPTIARLAAGETHDPIANILRKYGWKTAAFYPEAVFFVDAQKLKAYQETNFSFEYVKIEYMDAFKRLDQIDEFFRAENPRKAFLWLHLFEPHEKYEAHPGYDFGKSDLDRYDSEIAYADAAVGKILAYLEKNRPGAIVIITADHGEEFDDHGGRNHGSTLFEEQIRVPLIVSFPGVTPHVVGGSVELIDLAPTILGLLDLPVPPRMRGTDLGPWLAHPPAPDSALPGAFAEVRNKRMVARGNHKLICDLEFGYCEYFDLASDPREQKPRVDEQSETVLALRQRLDEWLDDHGLFEPELMRGLANPDGGDVPRAIKRGRLGDLSVQKELIAMARSNESLPVRREAARLLVVSLPARQETKNALIAALDADDPEVRSWIATAAARLGDERAKGRVRELLAGSPPPDLQLHAALALATAGDRTGVPVLGAALDDCNDRVELCGLIILRLGDVRDPRAVPALLKTLLEVQNRREKVEALGKIGDPSALDALVGRLREDEYVPVRAEAARALGKIGGSRARVVLESAARREREPPVQEAIAQALAGVTRPDASTPPASPDTRRSPPPATRR